VLVQEFHDHVARHAQFVDMWFAEDTLQDRFDLVVTEMATDGGLDPCPLVLSNDRIHDAFEHRKDCPKGSEFPKERLYGGLIHGNNFFERFVRYCLSDDGAQSGR
jgi:hypothetical protein